jgi:predicted AAA+ superfamily ATPase
MCPDVYQPRIADEELADRLRSAGAVVVEGPKACGKTAMARQAAASEVLLDVDQEAREAIGINPSLVLEGPTPRLIDEWQIEPLVWNQVRRAVDDRGEPGQFILAGSATPADDITRHSGAGRFSRLRLRTMSLFELGASNGGISLAGLLAGHAGEATEPDLVLPGVAEEICRGGWPGLRELTLAVALERVGDYLEEICRTDVGTVDGGRRDPERVRRLVRSVARNLATHASLTTLVKDTAGPDGQIKDETARRYLAALERLFVVEDQPAWEPHLRSKYVLRKAAKRHFVDPSLAVAALGASPQSLLKDLRLLGFLFESLVVRDLRVYAQPLRGRVKQYRDSSGLEVDAIVETGDTWAAFEVKLGGVKAIDAAAASLLRFAKQIDTSRVGDPAALAVITAGGYGYLRDDGIQVIPVGALGP